MGRSFNGQHSARLQEPSEHQKESCNLISHRRQSLAGPQKHKNRPPLAYTRLPPHQVYSEGSARHTQLSTQHPTWHS
ncbi:hypothetical protein I7I48_02700 [Histoplasma ohiense]|nr:hypothetical protein I7I48_02700 [Histoplasma ohiense (nom. inval.)]